MAECIPSMSRSYAICAALTDFEDAEDCESDLIREASYAFLLDACVATSRSDAHRRWCRSERANSKLEALVARFSKTAAALVPAVLVGADASRHGDSTADGVAAGAASDEGADWLKWSATEWEAMGVTTTALGAIWAEGSSNPALFSSEQWKKKSLRIATEQQGLCLRNAQRCSHYSTPTEFAARHARLCEAWGVAADVAASVIAAVETPTPDSIGRVTKKVVAATRLMTEASR